MAMAMATVAATRRRCPLSLIYVYPADAAAAAAALLLLVLVALPRLLAVRDGLCHKQLQAVAGPAAVFSHVLPKSMLVLLMLLLSLPHSPSLSPSFPLFLADWLLHFKSN